MPHWRPRPRSRRDGRRRPFAPAERRAQRALAPGCCAMPAPSSRARLRHRRASPTSWARRGSREARSTRALQVEAEIFIAVVHSVAGRPARGPDAADGGQGHAARTPLQAIEQYLAAYKASAWMINLIEEISISDRRGRAAWMEARGRAAAGTAHALDHVARAVARRLLRRPADLLPMVVGGMVERMGSIRYVLGYPFDDEGVLRDHHERITSTAHASTAANRGEIAIRIARAAAEPASPPSRSTPTTTRVAAHPRRRRGARPSGAARGPISTSSRSIAGAQGGRDALHPGYGFLSENADSPGAAPRRASFVGPTRRRSTLFGDKAAGQRSPAMRRAGARRHRGPTTSTRRAPSSTFGAAPA